MVGREPLAPRSVRPLPGRRTPYERTGGSSAMRRGKEAATAITTTTTGSGGARGTAATEAAADVIEPMCEHCHAVANLTEDVMRSYWEVLAGARDIFLADVAHHQAADECWVRVLRALGASEETYFARGPLVSLST